MKKVIYICAVFIIGACSPIYNGGGQPLAQMTFEHIKPYPVYTAAYELVPFIRDDANILPEGFIADPAKLAHDYLKARFEASGSRGKLRIVIKDASVTHEVTPSNTKVGAAFGLGQRDHYIVTLIVKLQLYGVGKYEHQETTLTAHRNIYISEYASIVERESEQMKALDSLIDDLDGSIYKVLKNNYSIIN